MSDDLDAFYRERWRLCRGFQKMVNGYMRYAAIRMGYANRSFPESMLREALDVACEEVDRDMRRRGIVMSDEDFRLVKAWLVRKVFGSQNKIWVVKK